MDAKSLLFALPVFYHNLDLCPFGKRHGAFQFDHFTSYLAFINLS